MSATNSNCVEVTFNTSGGTIDWSLYKGGDLSLAAETTNANNDTFWTGCFDEPFDCAELRVLYVPSENDISIQPPPYSANLHVVWNDTIWVEGWTPVSDAYHNNNGDVSVVWIGNECHKYSYNLCMTNPNTWTWNGANDDSNMLLLDVQLTTKALLNDNNINPEDEFPIYWNVYSDFIGGLSILLNDPFYFKYRSNNATYRSLSCIEYKDGCTEFGIDQISAVASHPIIRVNGIEKTDRYTNCSDELCHGDIMTPLEGCDFWSQLSRGARAGIVLAAVAGAVILYVVAADFSYILRQKRNERRQEEARA